VPAVSIAAIIEHNTSSLLALAESGISEPGDLAGHTYGGFGGQLETELVDRLVTCGGGDPGTVDHVEVGQTDYRVGLEQGDYDVIWVFDGWDKIRLEQDGVEVNTIPFIEHQECIPDWYTPLIATSESLIADDPELVSDFLEATADGYRLAIDDPGLAADHLLAAAPELDEALVRASAEYLAGRYASEPTSWGRQDRAVWVEFDQFLVDAGLIDDPVDVDAAFTNDLLPGGAS
jgi:ABC-type nitrate/sulfonate/bicarbonate transport system substrate-binding protein